MTRDQIASTAAGLMSAAAAGLSLFVAPLLESADLTLKLLAFALASIGFYVVFLVATHILARIRYRKLRGKWYYVTHPYADSPHQDSNYALMTFNLNRDYDLEYVVHLYGSLEALSSPKSAQVRGMATSKALHYSLESGRVYVLFEVKYLTGDPSNTAREGRLSLTLSADGTLAGDWTSEVYRFEDKVPMRASSSGKMVAYRTIDDLEKYEELRRAEA